MIAYLISVYCDAPHLRRLVEALDEDADFYVHIDANVDDAPFRRLLPEKAHFVPRHAVSWGGFEQVAYQYELIKAAVDSGVPYTRLVCLSGQDYPLWSNARIHRFFGENKTREFIGGFNITRGGGNGQLYKITHIHPFRDLKWQNRWLKNKLVVASRMGLGLLGVRRRPQVLIDGVMCDVYFGSDYWALTLDCARYVKRKLEENPSVIRYFRTTFAPSELCIHTIVYNSPFGERAMLHEGAYPGLVNLTPLHALSYQGSVKRLTLDDLPMLREGDKMFCRKVVTGVSDGLVDMIDSKIRSGSSVCTL